MQPVIELPGSVPRSASDSAPDHIRPLSTLRSRRIGRECSIRKPSSASVYIIGSPSFAASFTGHSLAGYSRPRRNYLPSFQSLPFPAAGQMGTLHQITEEPTDPAWRVGYHVLVEHVEKSRDCSIRMRCVLSTACGGW